MLLLGRFACPLFPLGETAGLKCPPSCQQGHLLAATVQRRCPCRHWCGRGHQCASSFLGLCLLSASLTSGAVHMGDNGVVGRPREAAGVEAAGVEAAASVKLCSDSAAAQYAEVHGQTSHSAILFFFFFFFFFGARA